MDPENTDVQEVIKKIKRTQRNAKCTVFALMVFKLLFILLQTVINILEIYDFGQDKDTERYEFWRNTFAISKVVFSVLQLPASLF